MQATHNPAQGAGTPTCPIDGQPDSGTGRKPFDLNDYGPYEDVSGFGGLGSCGRCEYEHRADLPCLFDDLEAVRVVRCGVCGRPNPAGSPCHVTVAGKVPARIVRPAQTSGVTLRAAAAYLVRHGWIQAAYYDATTGCFTPAADMVGAIGMVCYGGPVDAPAQHFNASGWTEFETAVAVLDEVLTNAYGQVCYEFNDTPGRTLREVRAALLLAGWLADGLHEIPLCCNTRMADRDNSPVVDQDDEDRMWSVMRLYICNVCQGCYGREIAKCATEERAVQIAVARRAGGAA